MIDRCRDDGLLVISAGTDVLRLAPPLIIEREQLAQALEVLEKALGAD